MHLRWQTKKFLLYNVFSYKRIRRIFNQRTRQAMAEGEEAMLMTPEEWKWAPRQQIEFIDGTEDDGFARSARFQRQFTVGETKGQKGERIAGLLAILRQRDMHRSAPMQYMLEQLPFEQLPPLELDLEVSSVVDFADRSGLINDHQLD